MSTNTNLTAHSGPTPTPGTQFSLQVDNDNAFVFSEQDGYCDRLALGGRVVMKTIQELKDIAIRILESQRKPTDTIGQVLEDVVKPERLVLNGEILERAFNAPSSGPHDRIVTMYDDTGRLRLASRAYADMAGVPAKALKALWNERLDAADRAMADKGLSTDEKEERRARELAAWKTEDTMRFLMELYDDADAKVAHRRVHDLAQNENPKGYQWVGRSRRGNFVHSHTLKFQGARGSVRDMQIVDEAVKAWVVREKRPHGEFRLPEGEYFADKAAAEKATSFSGALPWDRLTSTGDVMKMHRRLETAHTKSKTSIPEARMESYKRFMKHLTQVLGVGEFLWNDGLYAQTVWGGSGLEMANKAFCRYLGWSAEEAKNLDADGEFVAAIAAEPKDADAILRSASVGERDGDDHRHLTYRVKTRGSAGTPGQPAVPQRVYQVSEHVWRLLDGRVFRQLNVQSPTA